MAGRSRSRCVDGPSMAVPQQQGGRTESPILTCCRSCFFTTPGVSETHGGIAMVVWSATVRGAVCLQPWHDTTLLQKRSAHAHALHDAPGGWTFPPAGAARPRGG